MTVLSPCVYNDVCQYCLLDRLLRLSLCGSGSISAVPSRRGWGGRVWCALATHRPCCYYLILEAMGGL